MSQGLATKRKSLKRSISDSGEVQIPRLWHRYSRTSYNFLQGFMTVAEVAKHLGVSRSTVYQLCDRGEQGHMRVPNAIRVPMAVVVAFLRHRSR